MIIIGRRPSRNGRVISTPQGLFDRHVRFSDGCWEWSGYRNGKGYGFTRIGGRGSKGIFAHRLSWELHNGPIPDGFEVLHRCDNPACVRPNHLFLGTNADNIADRIAKGRPGGGCFLAGDSAPNGKWSEAQISEMRSERVRGALVKDIAARHGINKDYLSKILNGHLRRRG